MDGDSTVPRLAWLTADHPRVLSFFRKESDLENDMRKSSALPLVLGFTLTVAVCSSDNVAVYVPIFTTMSPMEISIVFWISLGLTVLVVWGTHALATQTSIGAWIHRLERTIIPLVLLFIGVWILFDSQVLSFGI